MYCPLGNFNNFVSMSCTVVAILNVFAVLVAMDAVALQAEAARAFFVFGDSLVDCGNNNYLATTARADSPPYGIDFPNHQPTGRFSNGLNFPDLIGEAMGLEPSLPILSPDLRGQKLISGANFASAGIGILNDTGVQFVSVLRVFRQFELFQQYQQRISAIIGPSKAKQLVNNAVFLITVGGNDFVNNYFLPLSVRSRQLGLPDYCQYLISEYKKALLRLHEFGGRRILVTGVGPLGCVPGQLAMSRSRNGVCASEPQRASSMFNTQLFQLIEQLNSEIGSDVFVAANAFSMNMDLISNPQKFGFTTSKMACCGQGPYNGFGLCTVLSNICNNRSLHVFWDAYHPTERANRVLVQELMMSGPIEYMKPMNLSTIMAVDAKAAYIN